MFQQISAESLAAEPLGTTDAFIPMAARRNGLRRVIGTDAPTNRRGTDMGILKTAVTSAVVFAGGLVLAPDQAEAGGRHTLGSYGLYRSTGYGFGGGYGQGAYYGGTGYRNYNYGAGYGSGYGGHYHGGYNHGGTTVWHDTSHYDYVPGIVVPHGNHSHYIPGHLEYHQTGHYDHYGPGHFSGINGHGHSH